MQDEVNEKTVSLCIRGGKITAQLLKAAMRKALAQMEQEKAKQKQQSKVQKQQDDKAKDKSYRGKQTMEKLMRQNVQLSNIEITDGNIKSFERVAEKRYDSKAAEIFCFLQSKGCRCHDRSI